MKEMSLTEHLEELRGVAIKIALILIASFFICYGLSDQIAEILLTPLRKSLGGTSGKIVYLGLLDKVLAQLQVAFWSSLIVSSPLWFWQLWQFIRPALYDREIKAIRPFIFIGFIFFSLGVLFGQLIVFPLTFQTLLSFGVKDVQATIGLKDYLILASKVLVFLGLVFQLPNLLLILGLMGLVDRHRLRSWRRYIYVAFSILSAMLTPPDPYTMLGLWVPLVLLFEMGILAVAIMVKDIAVDVGDDSKEKIERTEL